MEDYMFWIIVVVVAGIIEALTLNLASIWFVPSGLIVMLLSFTGIPFWLQVIIFIVLSVVSLWFLYPLAKNKLKIGSVKTNYETVIGKTGKVTLTIDNINALGQVKVEGQIWTARAAIEDFVIEAGKEVKVLDVKGVKLIVEELKEA